MKHLNLVFLTVAFISSANAWASIAALPAEDHSAKIRDASDGISDDVSDNTSENDQEPSLIESSEDLEPFDTSTDSALADEFRGNRRPAILDEPTYE